MVSMHIIVKVSQLNVGFDVNSNNPNNHTPTYNNISNHKHPNILFQTLLLRSQEAHGTACNNK